MTPYKRGEPYRKIVYYVIGLVFAVLSVFGFISADQAGTVSSLLSEALNPLVTAAVALFAGSKVHKGSDSTATWEEVIAAFQKGKAGEPNLGG